MLAALVRISILFVGLLIVHAPPIHQIFYDCTNVVRVYEINGKQGLVSEKSMLITAPLYEYIGYFRNGVAPAHIDGKWGLLSQSGKAVLSFQYDYVMPIDKELFEVQVAEHKGIVDAIGSRVIAPVWDSIEIIHMVSIPGEQFSYAYLVRNKHQYGLLDGEGKEIFPTAFESIQYLNDRSFLLEQKNKYGVVSLDTKLYSNIRWDYVSIQGVSERCDGLYPMRLNNSWGYIDIEGNLAIAPFLASDNRLNSPIGCFHSSLALAKRGDKYGYIDASGQFIIAPQWSLAYPFSDGVACVGDKNEECFYVINNAGEQLLKVSGTPISGRFTKGALIVRSSGKTGMINKSGEYYIPLGIYDWIDPEDHDDRRRVSKNFLFGFVDELGNEVVPPVFDEVGDFNDGVAAVRKQDSWGYIDLSGEMVIPVKYMYATDFNAGRALAARNGAIGNIWWPEDQGSLRETIEFVSRSISEIQWYLIDEQGNEMLIDGDGKQLNALYFMNGVTGVDLLQYEVCAYFDYKGNLLRLLGEDSIVNRFDFAFHAP